MTLPSSSRNEGEPGRIRVLLLGYGHLGIGLLRGLLQSDACEVVGVFRWSGRPASRSYWDDVERDFAGLIRNHGLHEIRCAGVNSYEFVNLLQRLQPDMILVGSWGEILKPHILNLPGLLLVNCHPSLLPAHRGANPYASVLLAEEAQTGVSFHLITEKIDAGPVLLQQALPISELDTGGTLRDRCAELAEAMVPELITRLWKHRVAGYPLELIHQPPGKQPYYPQLKIEDGLIDWHAAPAALSARFRALSPWVACYSFLDGHLLILFQEVRLVQAEQPLPSVAPGMIAGQRKGAFWVTTADPQKWLHVSRYRICWGMGYFPTLLSRWLGRWLFRPGRRFGPQV